MITCFIIFPCTWNVQKRQIHREIMVKVWADTDGESVLSKYEVSFWGDKSVLELDSGDDCMGFSDGSAVKNPSDIAGDTDLVPESERSFGEENDNPFQCFLPGKSHGQRILTGYSSWGSQKNWTWLATKQPWWLENIMNILETTELYTSAWLKWWMSYKFYLNKERSGNPFCINRNNSQDIFLSFKKASLLLQNSECTCYHLLSSQCTNCPWEQKQRNRPTPGPPPGSGKEHTLLQGGCSCWLSPCQGWSTLFIENSNLVIILMYMAKTTATTS